MVEQMDRNGQNFRRTWRHKICDTASSLVSLAALRSVSLYAAVAILGTVFFFFLHYLGNQIPYDLAKKRFAAEFQSNRQDEGHALHIKSDYEYCEISSSVMAGAGGSSSPFLDSVQLKVFRKNVNPLGKPQNWSFCGPLKAVVDGVDWKRTNLKTRYWWGSKALYAIALHWMSIDELRELTKIVTYLAYLLLAISLLLFFPRGFLVIAPLCIFGIFLSGIEYWADVANGIPYAWAVLSATVLVLLVRGQTLRWMPLGTARIFCFIMGMVSSYLWLGDGHTFLSITLIGMVSYFGDDHRTTSERAMTAVSCITLYLAGFVICYAFGLLAKSIVLEWERVVWNFWSRVIYAFDLTVANEAVQSFEKLFQRFSIMVVGRDPVRRYDVLVYFSATALTASLGFAAFLAYRGRVDLLRDVLWVVGLMLISIPQFGIPEDFPFRTARFVFVPLALCLSCLVLVIMRMNSRSSLTFGTLLTGCIFLVISYPFYYSYKFRKEVLVLIEDSQPIIRSYFDVYLHNNQLIYTKCRCTDEDIDPRFFLHIVPIDEKDIPDHRRHLGFDNLDFWFRAYKRQGSQDGRCVAARSLPNYRITSIRTGQFIRKGRTFTNLWQSEFRVEESQEPMASVLRP